MEWRTLFLLFCFANSLGALFNHIDDTDETYGYWEPLHFLLFGHGMQTWEYAPRFAIRSYAFLIPLFLPLSLLKQATSNKHVLFLAGRLLLGTFAAFAQSSFVVSIFRQTQLFPSILSKITCMLMLCSSGMFFSSTSFLPSAVASSLLMLSISEWLEIRYTRSIAWGALCVLWTGWPFVGLAFLPLGLQMLYALWHRESDSASSAFLRKLSTVLLFILQSIFVVALLFLPAVLIDAHFYNRWTVPGLNILLYNALAGRGDELYGVEPASYYVKNLFLNCNFSWLLVLLSPVSLIYAASVYRKYDPQVRKDPSKRGSHTRHNMSIVLAIYAVVYLWLGTLFCRPHKEERFLYPIYGPMAFVATHTLLVLLNLKDILCALIDKNQVVLRRTPLSRLILAMVMALALVLSVSRILANYHNYFGYFQLLQGSSHLITHPHPNRETRVCIGAEWHRFPSHFLFDDDRVRLHYIRDRFYGILPQPYGAHASDPPLLAVNDQNREEIDRYVAIEDCDYLLTTIEAHSDVSSLLSLHVCTSWLSEYLASDTHINLYRSYFHNKHCSGDSVFRVVAAEKVLSYDNPITTTSRWGRMMITALRAYYMPMFSAKHVPTAGYALLKQLDNPARKR